MREIKFRAWISNKFYYWGFIKDNNGVYFAAPAAVSSEPLDNKEIEKRSQQYTGLKDKNGKEIYEGDIGLFDCAGGKIKSTIVWNNFVARFERDDIPYLAGGIEGLCEVIGNIYENPELLKEDR